MTYGIRMNRINVCVLLNTYTYIVRRWSHITYLHLPPANIYYRYVCVYCIHYTWVCLAWWSPEFETGIFLSSSYPYRYTSIHTSSLPARCASNQQNAPSHRANYIIIVMFIASIYQVHVYVYIYIAYIS